MNALNAKNTQKGRFRFAFGGSLAESLASKSLIDNEFGKFGSLAGQNVRGGISERGEWYAFKNGRYIPPPLYNCTYCQITYYYYYSSIYIYRILRCFIFVWQFGSTHAKQRQTV